MTRIEMPRQNFRSGHVLVRKNSMIGKPHSVMPIMCLKVPGTLCHLPEWLASWYRRGKSAKRS